MNKENDNKSKENVIENRCFKPKIIRNYKDREEEKNIKSHSDIKENININNNLEKYKEDEAIMTPKILKNMKNNKEENTTTNYSDINNIQNFYIDKEQLYETFLLFQNFMNSNYNTTRIFNSSSKKENKIENNDIELNNNNAQNKMKEEKEKTLDSNEDKSELNKEMINKNNNNESANNLNKNLINNFDEIPIKPSNTNFEELLEINLANEKYEEPKSPPKKKIIKKEIKKKVISISKPSKNDKKYTYYTDLLDEEGHLDEKKIKLEQYRKNSSRRTSI